MPDCHIAMDSKFLLVGVPSTTDWDVFRERLCCLQRQLNICGICASDVPASLPGTGAAGPEYSWGLRKLPSTPQVPAEDVVKETQAS